LSLPATTNARRLEKEHIQLTLKSVKGSIITLKNI